MRVDTEGVSPVDFGLSRADAQMLYDHGRGAATDFLAGWDWEDYLRAYRAAPAT
jgi:NTE family protein